MSADVIVIGAGLSGLACARTLRQHGLEPLVLDASDTIGGRLRTDRREGFLLDRGFQVLQAWYPEARAMLDYRRLDLRPFYPGALVRTADRFHRVSDVWRRPHRIPEMLVSPIGTPMDKLRLAGLRRRCLRGDIQSLYERPETSALDLLRGLGFSPRMVDRFFKPFFSGVFFEPELRVSSRTFEFIFRAFALGDTALPARGMGEIPAQLAGPLPESSIRLKTKVARLEDRAVTLDSGERLRAGAVVVATTADETARLLHRQTSEPRAFRGTTCFYFAARRTPVKGPYLVLNGTGRGCVNSLLCPSSLSEFYAPPGQSLVTVNVHGADQNPDTLETRIRAELRDWLGDQVNEWRRLAVYRLPQALPEQRPPVPFPGGAPLRAGDRLWTCGEYQSAPSIQWTLHSGRRAAQEVAEALSGKPAGRSPDRKHSTHH